LVYELRSYDIDPSLLDESLNCANDRALPILVGQFGSRMVGFWHAVGSEPVSPTNVHWTNAWHSKEEMLARWDEARATEQWKVTDQDHPKFHLKVQRTVLRAIPRSPFQ